MRNNKSILKTQPRFNNVFTEEINKIDDKRMQIIDSIETCIWNGQRSSM